MKPEQKLQIRSSAAELLIFTRQAGEDCNYSEFPNSSRMNIWTREQCVGISDILPTPATIRNSRTVIRKFRTTAADGNTTIPKTAGSSHE